MLCSAAVFSVLCWLAAREPPTGSNNDMERQQQLLEELQQASRQSINQQ